MIHCHTWYTHLAGCLARQLTGPLVLTTHSLEPHRPWKVEQLGTAYHASSWIERTAYQNADGVIAVSEAMREDVHSLYGVTHERIRVIPNGIDLDQYKPTPDRCCPEPPRDRSRQTVTCFSSAASLGKRDHSSRSRHSHIRPGTQIVLCAAPPTRRRSAGR